MSHSTFLELTKENHILADLLYRDMEVLHSRIYLLKVIQFMIVGSEQGLCTISVLMNILHDRTCDGHSVICRCSSSYFIKEHQRTG